MKPIVKRLVAGVFAVVGLILLTGLVTLTRVDERPFSELPELAGSLNQLQISSTAAGSEAEPGRAPALLSAGFGRVKLTPTLGSPEDAPERGVFRFLPLAGYGNRKGKPAEGIHDDIWVKAIALVSGGKTGVVVCADALIIPREVAAMAMDQLGTKVGLTREQVYFSATHTHCSLGGWGEGLVGESFAGPFQPAVRVWFAQQLAAAASMALKDLKPSSLGTSSFDAPQFIRNRLVGDRGRVDSEFALVLIRQDSGGTAVLGSYGAHATILGGGTLQFSAEYPGAWQRAIENATGGLALFAAGAVGSHGHKAPKGGFEGVEAMGQSLAQETLKRLPDIALTNALQFDVLGLKLQLPSLQTRVSSRLRLRPWVAARLLPVGQDTFLQGFRLGQTLWLSTPCDFSGELALDLKAESRARGTKTVVTSFNGDYVGYVIPASYYNLGGYEPQTMSFFGPQVPDYFMEALRRISTALMTRPSPQDQR